MIQLYSESEFPVSGIRGMIWDIIEPELKKRQFEYESFRTEYPGHASKITEGSPGSACLVVLGGNGTIKTRV